MKRQVTNTMNERGPIRSSAPASRALLLAISLGVAAATGGCGSYEAGEPSADSPEHLETSKAALAARRFQDVHFETTPGYGNTPSSAWKLTLWNNTTPLFREHDESWRTFDCGMFPNNYACRQPMSSYGGGDIHTTPAAISLDHRDQVNIFYVGINGLVNYYGNAHAYANDHFTGGYSGDWGKPAGYQVFGTPGVTGPGPNRLEVYVLAHNALAYNNTTAQIFRRYYDIASGYFSGWLYVASVPMSSTAVPYDTGIAAVASGGGRIDLFANGDTLTGYNHVSTANDGLTWSKDVWTTSSPITGPAKAASAGSGRFDLFYPSYYGTVTSPVLGHVIYDHGVITNDPWGNPCDTGAVFYGYGLRGADAVAVGYDFSIQATVSCTSPINLKSPSTSYTAEYSRVGGFDGFEWRMSGFDVGQDWPEPHEPNVVYGPPGRYRSTSGSLVILVAH